MQYFRCTTGAMPQRTLRGELIKSAEARWANPEKNRPQNVRQSNKQSNPSTPTISCRRFNLSLVSGGFLTVLKFVADVFMAFKCRQPFRGCCAIEELGPELAIVYCSSFGLVLIPGTLRIIAAAPCPSACPHRRRVHSEVQ